MSTFIYLYWTTLSDNVFFLSFFFFSFFNSYFVLSICAFHTGTRQVGQAQAQTQKTIRGNKEDREETQSGAQAEDSTRISGLRWYGQACYDNYDIDLSLDEKEKRTQSFYFQTKINGRLHACLFKTPSTFPPAVLLPPLSVSLSCRARTHACTQAQTYTNTNTVIFISVALKNILFFAVISGQIFNLEKCVVVPGFDTDLTQLPIIASLTLFCTSTKLK